MRTGRDEPCSEQSTVCYQPQPRVSLDKPAGLTLKNNQGSSYKLYRDYKKEKKKKKFNT